MKTNFYNTLLHMASDAEMEILFLEKNKIKISVLLPSLGGETWLIKSDNVVHLDLSPTLTLGHIEFGSLSLLPAGYLKNRNVDYGGKKDEYRVAHIVDVDGKDRYLILYGRETVVKDISSFNLHTHKS